MHSSRNFAAYEAGNKALQKTEGFIKELLSVQELKKGHRLGYSKNNQEYDEWVHELATHLEKAIHKITNNKENIALACSDGKQCYSIFYDAAKKVWFEFDPTQQQTTTETKFPAEYLTDKIFKQFGRTPTFEIIAYADDQKIIDRFFKSLNELYQSDKIVNVSPSTACLAARFGHKDVLEAIPLQTITTLDENGLSPLMIAARYGHVDSVEMLLNKLAVKPSVQNPFYGNFVKILGETTDAAFLNPDKNVQQQVCQIIAAVALQYEYTGFLKSTFAQKLDENEITLHPDHGPKKKTLRDLANKIRDKEKRRDAVNFLNSQQEKLASQKEQQKKDRMKIVVTNLKGNPEGKPVLLGLVNTYQKKRTNNTTLGRRNTLYDLYQVTQEKEDEAGKKLAIIAINLEFIQRLAETKAGNASITTLEDTAKHLNKETLYTTGYNENDFSLSILKVAAQHGHVSIVKILLDKMAVDTENDRSGEIVSYSTLLKILSDAMDAVDVSANNKNTQEIFQAIATFALKNKYTCFFVTTFSDKLESNGILLDPLIKDEKGKTLIDLAEKIEDGYTRSLVLQSIMKNSSLIKEAGKSSDIDMKRLKKYKEDVFALIQNDPEILSKALRKESDLHKFFALQRGILKPSENRGMLKKINLQYILHKLKDNKVDDEFIEKNKKHKEAIFDFIIQNDKDSLKQAATPNTALFKLFIPSANQGYDPIYDLYRLAEKIGDKNKKKTAINTLHQCFLDRVRNELQPTEEKTHGFHFLLANSKEIKQLKKYKEDIFELIKDDQELLGLALDHPTSSGLHDFFALQRGIRATSEERGTLKKIRQHYVQKLLARLKDGEKFNTKTKEFNEFIENNDKYKKDIFELIRNDKDALGNALNNQESNLYKYFRAESSRTEQEPKKPGFFSRNSHNNTSLLLIEEMGKVYKKLRAAPTSNQHKK